MLTRLDIVPQAGAPHQALVKRLEPVRARGALTIDLIPVAGREPILCAIEIKELEDAARGARPRDCPPSSWRIIAHIAAAATIMDSN